MRQYRFLTETSGGPRAPVLTEVCRVTARDAEEAWEMFALHQGYRDARHFDRSRSRLAPGVLCQVVEEDAAR